MDPWLALIGQVGLPGALVCYFVWRGDKRETRMGLLLTAQQTKIEEIYSGAINDLKGAVTDSKQAMHDNTKALGELREETKQQTGIIQKNHGILSELREETKEQTRVLSGLECLKPWDGRDRRMGFGDAKAAGE